MGIYILSINLLTSQNADVLTIFSVVPLISSRKHEYDDDSGKNENLNEQAKFGECRLRLQKRRKVTPLKLVKENCEWKIKRSDFQVKIEQEIPVWSLAQQ